MRIIRDLKKKLLLIGNRKFSLYQISFNFEDDIDIEDPESLFYPRKEYNPFQFNSGEIGLEISCPSSPELNELRDLFRKEFRIIGRETTYFFDYDLWDCRERRLWDWREEVIDTSLVVGYFCIRLYRKDHKRFLDFLRWLSREKNYKTIYKGRIIK